MFYFESHFTRIFQYLFPSSLRFTGAVWNKELQAKNLGQVQAYWLFSFKRTVFIQNFIRYTDVVLSPSPHIELGMD